jgi:hypothetical protein
MAIRTDAEKLPIYIPSASIESLPFIGFQKQMIELRFQVVLTEIKKFTGTTIYGSKLQSSHPISLPFSDIFKRDSLR